MQSFPNYSHKSHFSIHSHKSHFFESLSQITHFESSSQIALFLSPPHKSHFSSHPHKSPFSNSLHYKHPNNKNIPKTPPPPLGERNFYFWKNKPPTLAPKLLTKVTIVTSPTTPARTPPRLKEVYFFKSNKFFLSVLPQKRKKYQTTTNILSTKLSQVRQKCPIINVPNKKVAKRQPSQQLFTNN